MGRKDRDRRDASERDSGVVPNVKQKGALTDSGLIAAKQAGEMLYSTKLVNKLTRGERS